LNSPHWTRTYKRHRPTRFSAEFGELFPFGAFALGVQPSMAFSVDSSVKVRISADHQPVPPEKIAGFPFAPVEFAGLTITPYADNKGRIAHGFRASGMQAPGGVSRRRRDHHVGVT